MKANQRILLDRREDAVSPVIAVILMVAITVVLAATVYLWVSGFGSNQGQLVNASFAAKAIDLPWASTDADDSDDAIEITYTSGSGDLNNAEIQIFINGNNLSWSAPWDNFVESETDHAVGDFCTNSPGGDTDDIWERGASVFLIIGDHTDSQGAECDGSVTLANLGNMDQIHLLKVSVKGQVVLDTTIEVHDDAGA